MQKQLYLTDETIASRVRHMARLLARSSRAEVMVPIMNGACMFAPALLTALGYSVYGGNTKDLEWEPLQFRRNEDGVPLKVSTLLPNILKRRVMIVDTIYDSGRTALAVQRLLANYVESMEFVFLISRTHETPNLNCAEMDCPVSVGFHLGDEQRFLVGYGLDYHGKMRGDPNIWLTEE